MDTEYWYNDISGETITLKYNTFKIANKYLIVNRWETAAKQMLLINWAKSC